MCCQDPGTGAGTFPSLLCAQLLEGLRVWRRTLGAALLRGPHWSWLGDQPLALHPQLLPAPACSPVIRLVQGRE